ncbi:hypothetical protein niasHS_012087 [Heterodera schachtii]|uniref:Macro domain-containing protein n=1 Tax=Heterodera schachtii TaxID=97005 RepID=A0ABD2IK37_HETSC
MNKILDDDKTVDEKQKDNSENGEKTGAENDNEPKAAFWENAIGPFLFVFENMDKRDRRSIWKPMIKELNRMRREQMGRKFEGLTWDERLTDKVRLFSFTEIRPLSVVIKRPTDGVAPNLLQGFQTLFSALIWQNVSCDRFGECRVATSERRIPGELIDSKARRIGCNARIYKGTDRRELRFAAVCATDRSTAGDGKDNLRLELFRLNDLQNVRLREKLRWEAVDTFGQVAAEEKRRSDQPKNVRPSSAFRPAVTVQSADIVRVRADAIVDPLKGSLFAALLQSPAEETTEKVLGAKSILDILEMEDDEEEEGKGMALISKANVRRQLRGMAQLLEEHAKGNGTEAKRGAGERAARAKQQLEHWLQALKVPQTFAALRAEAERWRRRKSAMAGADQRILAQGGAALKEKLRQLAQRRGAGDALVAGDAIATDAFEISDKYYAKAIIHTVPPTDLLTQRDSEKLADCFRRSLEIASSRGFSSVAFPEMLAKNASERDKERAAQIGVEAVAKWMAKHPKGKVNSVLFVIQQDNKHMLEQYQQLVEQKFGNKN